MRSIVEELIRIDGVIGALLVDKDGLVVSSTPLEEEDAEVLGAMAAAIYATLAKACERIGVGRPANLTVEANEGVIQLMEAENLLLVVITERRVNSDHIKAEMSRASERVHEAMPLLYVRLTPNRSIFAAYSPANLLTNQISRCIIRSLNKESHCPSQKT